MTDAYDEKAREITRRNAASWACDMVGEIAQALRETAAEAEAAEKALSLILDRNEKGTE